MRKLQNRKYLTLILLVLALICVLLLSGCMSIADLPIFAPPPQDEMNPLVREYANLLEMIEQLYIGEFDVSEIHAEAMRALVNALDDDWSFYMTQEEYADFIFRATNSFHGIGVEILANPELRGMEIVRVFRGSPAESGGILPGDVMTYIDGESLYGLSVPEVRALLARPIGEFAEIHVIRNGVDEVLLTIMFSEVFIDPINFEILDGNIGYISIANFDASSGERFISVVEEMIEMGAVSFIFDVRTNSGGSVREMTAMLDFLLPEGEIFIHVDRGGEERIIESDSDWLDMPAVVLVNRYSFSAAEYFAALLSEFDYALVVGEQTSGKNRSQTTHLVPDDGGALHISTGQYLTKNRINLGDIGGFTPDFVIEHTDEEMSLLLVGELDFDDDPQLIKAIELLVGIEN